mgnify:CR=1 FL=1
METDLFFVVIILKLLFYKTLWLYLVYLSIALVQYFQNIKKKNIFPPKITKVFKSIWSVLKPTLPFILSVYFVISVPLFILQEAGLSYKLIGQMVIFYIMNETGISCYWFAVLSLSTLIPLKLKIYRVTA